MADINEQLTQSKDRITQLLAKGAPDVADIGRAFSRATSGTASYGEELNAMRAARLKEQSSLFDVLSGYKGLQQNDIKLGLQQQKNAYDILQAARKNGVQDAEAIGKAIDRYVPNQQDRSVVASYLHSLPDQVTALNADNVVSQAVNDLSSSGKIARTKQPTPTDTSFTYGNWLPNGSQTALTARRTNKGNIQVLKDGNWMPVEKVGPGSFIGQSVQASSVGGLSANKTDEIKADLNNVQQARNRVSDILQSVQASKDRAGITGTIKGMGQTMLGIAGDLADFGINTGGVIDSVIPQVVKDLNADKIDGEVATYFDKSLPQNQVFENSLAYSLARARKGDKRINMEDFRIAKHDVNITGLTSYNDVIARLGAIDKEFADAERSLKSRLGEAPTPTENTPVWEFKDGKLVPVQ